MSKRNQILALSQATPTRENENLQNKVTKWVSFFKGSSNTYINDLATRYRRTATLNAIINSKVNYSIGKSLSFNQNNKPKELKQLPNDLQNFLKNSNSDFQNLREVLKESLFDWITFGNVYIHVVKTKSGNQTSRNIYSIDATKCRIDEKGKNCFISANWRDIKDNRSFDKRFKIQTVPLWNKKIDTNQTSFIIHLKRKTPEFDFYGLPDYIATLKDCDIEYKIDTYNLDVLENGFFPSVSITQVGSPPEGKTPKEYVSDLKDSYTGEGKAGKMVVQLVDDPTQAAIIHEFGGAKDGQLLQLEDSATKGIIKGSRFFPALAGIETAGKLGGTTELINQYNIVLQNMIIPDYQQPVLRVYDIILKILGFDINLGIINKSPVTIEDKISPNDVLDINEQREILGYEPNN